MEGLDRLALVALIASGYLLWAQQPRAALDPAAIPTLGGGTVDLSKCAGERCMTIVVAPWCGACQQAKPAIKELRDHLNRKGIACHVVVSMDRPDRLWAEAKAWGPGTAVDEGNFLRPQGVPHEYVSDASGRVVRDIPGFPMAPDVETTARAFGL